MTKNCARCHQPKDLNQFSSHRTQPDGLCSYCKDCHRIRNKTFNLQLKKRNPRLVLLNSSRISSINKKLSHNLTIEDIVIPKTCPVLGIPLFFDTNKISTKHSPNAPCLDRIDNTKGYIKENVVVVSWRANLLKRDASIDELKKIADFYDNLSK